MTNRTEQTARNPESRLRFRRPFGLFGLFSPFLLLVFSTPTAHAIMAGGEFDSPEDRPSLRLDPLGASSSFNFVGALELSVGGSSYFGTAAALSPNWVLSAGHNVDFDDNGVPDAGLAANFHLPGFGAYAATSFTLNPRFTGFGNPSIQNDLSLLYFDDPLPASLDFPSLGLDMEIGDVVTLAGFGRSGFGSYGYTTQASLTDRRMGANTIRSFEAASGGDGLLFRYDFDAPDSVKSLGNDIETLIGPGDSGGPALVDYGSGFGLVGINTFTEGFGGLFGDIGGGVALNDQWDWITETTGLALVPEPAASAFWLAAGAVLILIVRRRQLSK